MVGNASGDDGGGKAPQRLRGVGTGLTDADERTDENGKTRKKKVKNSI